MLLRILPGDSCRRAGCRSPGRPAHLQPGQHAGVEKCAVYRPCGDDGTAFCLHLCQHRLDAERGAAGAVAGAAAAVECCRLRLGFEEDAVGLEQTVGAVDLGDVIGIDGGQCREAGERLALMAGHVGTDRLFMGIITKEICDRETFF